MIRRLWNYLVGYVVIKIEGLSLEKFMNLTVSNGIYLWKVKREAYISLIACIGIDDFKKLPPILRKVGCRCKIIEKRGLPFVLHRFKNRKMLIVGMIIFLVLLYGISSFIWEIDILGTEKVDPKLILNVLSENGIEQGSFKGGIDIPNIENRIMIELPELSWVSIELKGAKAIVRVVEAVKPPEMLDKEEPCNVVAKKTGIIHKIITLEGQSVVEKGDTINQGEMLISGIIEHPDTGITRFVHAMGQVFARIWYEGTGEAYISDVSKKRTGAIITAKYIGLRDKVLPLDEPHIPFENYEVEERRKLFFGENRFVPIEFIFRDYHEIEYLNMAESKELVKEMADTLALKDAQSKMPEEAKIIDKKFKYDMIKEDGVKSIVYIEALEDIAVQEKIQIDQEESVFGRHSTKGKGFKNK